MVFVKYIVRYCFKFFCGVFIDIFLDFFRVLCKELCNVENLNWDWQEICWFYIFIIRYGCIVGFD